MNYDTNDQNPNLKRGMTDMVNNFSFEKKIEKNLCKKEEWGKKDTRDEHHHDHHHNHDHDHQHEKASNEITSLLVKYSSPRGKFTLPCHL